MKYRILFSVAVHERLETVYDLIKNLLFFNDDCAVVLHFSKGFVANSLISEETFYSLISNMNNVLINEIRIKTNANTLLSTHYLNYVYANKIIDFDYFSPCNSNDLYIKKGFYSLIKEYDSVLEEMELTNKWGHFKSFQSDFELVTFLSPFKLYISFLEGSCYSHSLFNSICEMLLQLNVVERKFFFPAEELVIPTLAMHFSNKHLFGRSVKNGVGALFVNKMIIRRTISSSNKFAVKRIDRDFYNYQRIYLRNRFKECKTIYADLGLAEKKVSLFKYVFFDVFGTIKNVGIHIGRLIKRIFKKL